MNVAKRSCNMDDTDLSRQYPSTSKKKKQNEEVPEMVGLMEERTQAVRRPDNQDQTIGGEQTLAVRRPDNQDQTTGGEQTLAVRRPDNQDQTTGGEQTLAVRRPDNQDQTTGGEQMLAVRRPDNQDQTTGGEQTLAVRRPDNQDLTTGEEQMLAVRIPDNQDLTTGGEQTLAVRRPDNQDLTTGEEQTLAVRRQDNQDLTTGGEQTLAVRRPDNQDQTTVFQQMLQTQHQVSGSGNIPINNPTDCTINIYQSKDSARISHQSGQSSGDTSENQPSTSQQPTTQGAVSNPLTPECSTSDVRSQAAAAKCKDALKLHYRTTGSYVQVNPWYDVDQKRIPVIYTRLQLANAKGNRRGTLVSYEDILVLKTEEGDLIKIAVLSGLAGRGKSTLFDKIAYDWVVDRSPALQKYELVFLLKMSYLEQVSDLTGAVFDQLIAENIANHTDKGALRSYIEKNADKVLILLDGFDELKTTSLSESSFDSILKLLSRKSFRGCTVLVSTRPSHFHRLVTKELVREPFTHVEVLGFEKKSIEEYVRRYFSDEPDKAKGLLERIGSFGNLSTLAESPMLLLLMCLLWREDSTLPETMSHLYQDAIEYIAKRKEVSKDEMSRVVVALGKVGLRGFLSPDQKLTFKESDFEQSVLDIALKVGILTRQRVCKRLKPYSVVQFIHKTFQEFCAAVYLQEMLQANTEEFHDTLNEIMSKDPLAFEYLLRFCCGDNEACTLEILKVFQERHQKDLSFGSKLGQLALHCYFEGQRKCLPPEEVMHSFLTGQIFVGFLDNDSINSIKYFFEQIKDSGNEDVSELHIETLPSYVRNVVKAFTGLPNLVGVYLSGCVGVQRIAKETKDSGNAYLADVKSVDISSEYVHVSNVVAFISSLPNLVTWKEEFDLCFSSSLNEQDRKRVDAKSFIRSLPNFARLVFSLRDLRSASIICRDKEAQGPGASGPTVSGGKLTEEEKTHIETFKAETNVNVCH